MNTALNARRYWLCGCLATTAAGASDFQGKLRLWSGSGVDSNPARSYQSATAGPAPSLFLSVLSDADGSWALQRALFLAGYSVGARWFATDAASNTLTQQASFESWAEAGRTWRFSASAWARDRRGAKRDYSMWRAELSALKTFSSNREFRLQAGAEQLIYWPQLGGSYAAPWATLSVRIQLGPRHQVSASVDVGFRKYRMRQRLNEQDELGFYLLSPAFRQDWVAQAGLTYAYRGPVRITAGYQYTEISSNSFGEGFARHRLNLSFGAVLWRRLTALASATGLFTHFRDGLALSPELLLIEADENQSSASLKLSYPLTRHLELDVKYAFYYGSLPQNDLLYVRHVVGTGVGGRW